MSSFSPVRNVRISSLTPGAVVQLRLGKAAVKSKDDVVISAKVLRHEEQGDKAIVVFEETDADGVTSELVISKYTGAPWRAQKQYVSLVGVDESTFTVQKATTPIATDIIDEAIKMINAEKADFYAADQALDLFEHVRTAKRVNTEVKSLISRYAHAIVAELKALPPRDQAA